MKRIFVPTTTGSDWQPLLSKPVLHWKKGASAMTAAAAWEGASGRLPPEIVEQLDSSGILALQGLQLLAALPEWKVPLPGGDTSSATDVLAICRNEHGLCVVGVEAKVLEDFGPTVGEKRRAASTGQQARLDYLHDLLGVPSFSDECRYQLLHRTASALLVARDFHASTAVMLVHAFDTPGDRRSDFSCFAREMGALQQSEGVHEVRAFSAPALYLVWCDGDPKFREVALPASVLCRAAESL